MADASIQAQTYTNAGEPNAFMTTNFEKMVINQADVGRELIVSASKTNMTNAELKAVRAQLTLAGGDRSGTDTYSPSAFTVAAFGTADGTAFASGVTDVVFFRLQGTGTTNTTTVSGVVLAVVAHFAPAL
jgi:hypothetical protein